MHRVEAVPVSVVIVFWAKGGSSFSWFSTPAVVRIWSNSYFKRTVARIEVNLPRLRLIINICKVVAASSISLETCLSSLAKVGLTRIFNKRLELN